MAETLAETRRLLPIYPFRDDLLKAIRAHQILIIVGETGSGKLPTLSPYQTIVLNLILCGLQARQLKFRNTSMRMATRKVTNELDVPNLVALPP